MNLQNFSKCGHPNFTNPLPPFPQVSAFGWLPSAPTLPPLLDADILYGWPHMLCLSRPYHFKVFKGCLPQILLGPFLNTLTHTVLQTEGAIWGSFIKENTFIKKRHGKRNLFNITHSTFFSSHVILENHIVVWCVKGRTLMFKCICRQQTIFQITLARYAL